MSTPLRERELVLNPELSSVTISRHFVRSALLEWGFARLVEDAELGVSELVANAVRYARTEVVLSVSAGDRVTIAVMDRDPMLHRPVGARVDELSESGRGLRIVASVSDDWGIEARPDGKSIWFNLTLPDRATVDAELLSLTQPFDGHRSAERRGPHTADVG